MDVYYKYYTVYHTPHNKDNKELTKFISKDSNVKDSNVKTSNYFIFKNIVYTVQGTTSVWNGDTMMQEFHIHVYN